LVLRIAPLGDWLSPAPYCPLREVAIEAIQSLMATGSIRGVIGKS
jgi:hypothetical protein